MRPDESKTRKRETKAPKKFADESFPTATKPKKQDSANQETKPAAKRTADTPVRIDLFSPQIRTICSPNGQSPVSRRSNGNTNPRPASTTRKSTADPSFDADVRNIRYVDVSRVFADSRIHFPQSTSVWLKDMTGYLNTMLPYELSPTFFKDKRSGCPSGLLQKDVVWFLCQMLDDCPEPTLQLFQSYCLDSLIRSIAMKTPATGYLIMLQLLGMTRPSVTFENITCFTDALDNNKRRSKVITAVCWAVNQSLMRPSSYPADLWRDAVSPLIEFEAISQQLERLEHLEKKMSKRSFPWKSLILLVLFVASAVITFDVQRSGSFTKSVTYRNLDNYGLIKTWRKSLATVTTYSAGATAWFNKNAPVYWSKIDPWLKYAATNLSIAYNSIIKRLSPALEWFVVTVEPVRRWIVKTVPPYIETAKSKVLPLIVSFAKDFTNAVVAVFIEFGKWIQDNVLVGNFSVDSLTKLAADLVLKIQSATGNTVTWLSDRVAAIVK